MEKNTEISVVETHKIKVYAKLDTNKVIKEVNSSIFIQDFNDWTQIDESDEIRDRKIFSHAQSQYLEKGLVDNKGRYNYKYDRVLIEITEEEKNTFFPPLVPLIDPKDILIAELSISLAETQAQGVQAIAELTEAIARLQIPTI